MKKHEAYNLMLGMLRMVLAAFEDIATNMARTTDERARVEAGADKSARS